MKISERSRLASRVSRAIGAWRRPGRQQARTRRTGASGLRSGFGTPVRYLEGEVAVRKRLRRVWFGIKSRPARKTPLSFLPQPRLSSARSDSISSRTQHPGPLRAPSHTPAPLRQLPSQSLPSEQRKTPEQRTQERCAPVASRAHRKGPSLVVERRGEGKGPPGAPGGRANGAPACGGEVEEAASQAEKGHSRRGLEWNAVDSSSLAPHRARCRRGASDWAASLSDLQCPPPPTQPPHALPVSESDDSMSPM